MKMAFKAGGLGAISANEPSRPKTTRNRSFRALERAKEESKLDCAVVGFWNIVYQP